LAHSKLRAGIPGGYVSDSVPLIEGGEIAHMLSRLGTHDE
jgi:hypothetical protein